MLIVSKDKPDLIRLVEILSQTFDSLYQKEVCGLVLRIIWIISALCTCVNCPCDGDTFSLK